MTQDDLLLIGACILATAPASGEPLDVRAKNALALFHALSTLASAPAKPPEPPPDGSAKLVAQLRVDLQSAREEMATMAKTIEALTAKAADAELPSHTVKEPAPGPSAPKPPKAR
jgi:hypothetical protein